MVYRIYVEKKAPYAVEAQSLKGELKTILGIRELDNLRLLQRYDIEGLSREDFARSIPIVFSEPPVDDVYFELPQGAEVFAVEFLPGQFDQRADSAAECVQLLCSGDRPTVASARVYVLDGAISGQQRQAVQRYVVNPVEARLADLAEKETLQRVFPLPEKVDTLTGFCALDDVGLAEVLWAYGLAMDMADLALCRDYFVSERRDPTVTEIRMLDTYWSDHCRHTTFLTNLNNIEIADEKVRATYERYLDLRRQLGRDDRPVTLMDLATIGARNLKRSSYAKDLDESDEINACSIRITVDHDGVDEEWLLLFKNETHNHPTEIEPFGGAATCLGGAIRDPLSGRAYVYQAMRVTGAGDPLAPIESTLPGKLPQRKLVTTAAAGYSSYGNQMGLATGLVKEIYHPGYIAKRMEIGAVVGAVPRKNVRRETPVAGDCVLLVGGKTGRDGCGGATGSSKAHDVSSIEECGAEVQKGNPPVERKLQRLFRNAQVARLIKRCNDFGAGGVSVAVGELAEGLDIDLDAIPKKYQGLDGTELAISESQERMAVVVSPKDVSRFLEAAAAENLEATEIAKVTADKRLVMRWNNQVIVDVARAFLDTNGAEKKASARIGKLPKAAVDVPQGTLQQRLESWMSDLNRCCQKGLSERFDATVGAGTVVMPFGGKYQLTPPQAMVAKLPVERETQTCSAMSYGFVPNLSTQNPFDGAYIAVVESVARLAATGLARNKIYLTFQEYFERLRDEPDRWGKPLAALLGALQAQLDLGVVAIGGKDSMSGSFEELDVPPTLVSFAVAPGNTKNIVSPEFKAADSCLVWLQPKYYNGIMPEAASFKRVLDRLESWIADGRVRSCWAVGEGGLAEGLCNMAFGNGIGVRLDHDALDMDALFRPTFGSFIVETSEPLAEGIALGGTTAEYVLTLGENHADLGAVQECWEAKLEPVMPHRLPTTRIQIPTVSYQTENPKRKSLLPHPAKPRALITVFPGTNCEYDTARALRRAGAEADIFVVRNLTPEMVAESVAELVRRIDQSQIIVIPGGFSAGDEPEGSAKLINAFFREPAIAEAVDSLLEWRDGLMLGICNGFQALLKLGLLPYGRIMPLTTGSPTLTFNRIGRHQSMLVHTRISSNLSPWLMQEPVGSLHTIAVSHGEGRFVCSQDTAHALAKGGQIAAQYVDLSGNPSADVRYNPNDSMLAVEALSSPDGRIFGKMGHSERSGDALYKNVPGNQYQKLFEGGVDYFK